MKSWEEKQFEKRDFYDYLSIYPFDISARKNGSFSMYSQCIELEDDLLSKLQMLFDSDHLKNNR